MVRDALVADGIVSHNRGENVEAEVEPYARVSDSLNHQLRRGAIAVFDDTCGNLIMISHLLHNMNSVDEE